MIRAASLEHLLKIPLILVATAYNGSGTKTAKWWLDNFPQAKRWPGPFENSLCDAVEKGLNVREWVAAALPKQWIKPQ